MYRKHSKKKSKHNDSKDLRKLQDGGRVGGCERAAFAQEEYKIRM